MPALRYAGALDGLIDGCRFGFQCNESKWKSKAYRFRQIKAVVRIPFGTIMGLLLVGLLLIKMYFSYNCGTQIIELKSKFK